MAHNANLGFTHVPGATVIKTPNTKAALTALNIPKDLADTFQNLATLKGPVSVFKPNQELETSRCPRTIKGLERCPQLLVNGRATAIGMQANRNFQYITFAYAHIDPQHDLNQKYIMQWRVDVEKNDDKIVPTGMRFCIKSRTKDIVRNEWEIKVEGFNEESAIRALQEKYKTELPPSLLASPEEIATKTFVSGTAGTSRTGYSGIQLRQKWRSWTFHEFSHDITVAATIKGPVAKRFEIEDEISGVIGDPKALSKKFSKICLGALEHHRARLEGESKVRGEKLRTSRLSKATFAQASSIGYQDKGQLYIPEWQQNTLSKSTMEDINLSAEHYFTNPIFNAVLKNILDELPEKGSVFQPAITQDYTHLRAA